MDNGNFNDDKRSPIFILFLDVIYQLINQYPTAFEFNGNFLLFLSDHIYSARFGTFMCDSDKDRNDYNVRTKTLSIWTYILDAKNITQFLNPDYTIYEKSLRPSSNIKHIKIWKDFFCRGDNDRLPLIKRNYDNYYICSVKKKNSFFLF